MTRHKSEPLPPELLRLLQPYSAEVREVFAGVRAAVLSEASAAVELIYDSYNAVAAAYSFTGRLKDAFCHAAAYSRHVNLGFNRGAELDDPEHMLQGSGKLIRHIRVGSGTEVERPYVVELIRQAAAQAPNGTESETRPLVVKSASQRKRRPSSR